MIESKAIERNITTRSSICIVDFYLAVSCMLYKTTTKCILMDYFNVSLRSENEIEIESKSHARKKWIREIK